MIILRHNVAKHFNINRQIKLRIRLWGKKRDIQVLNTDMKQEGFYAFYSGNHL